MKNQMRIKKKHLAGTLEVLAKSQSQTAPYTTTVAGKEFVVLPGVFSPAYFHDTEFFATNLPFEQGKSFLEIGPGTGSLTVLAALSGMRATAVDINPQAVRNTRLNAERHAAGEVVRVYEGDVYDPLPAGERFDIIFCNTPFAYVEDSRELTSLEKAVIDPGYATTSRIIREAPEHLAVDGKLLIGFSTTLGHFRELRRLLNEAEFRVRKLAEVTSVEVMPVKFQLFEATR